jgi:hypothetical protein
LPAVWKAMERPGKVNISSATYELIKDYYECSYRGKISAKKYSGRSICILLSMNTPSQKTFLIDQKQENSTIRISSIQLLFPIKKKLEYHFQVMLCPFPQL